MPRAYNVVDADGHILEPLDIWEKYIDPAYRDRAPRMIVDTAHTGIRTSFDALDASERPVICSHCTTWLAGARLRADIRAVAGLTGSVGLAASKMLAKVTCGPIEPCTPGVQAPGVHGASYRGVPLPNGRSAELAVEAVPPGRPGAKATTSSHGRQS